MLAPVAMLYSLICVFSVILTYISKSKSIVLALVLFSTFGNCLVSLCPRVSTHLDGLIKITALWGTQSTDREDVFV